MKKNFLFTLVFLLPLILFSQKTVKKADSTSAGGLYLDISGGLSVPMGAFANGDVTNSASGFANPGFLAQLNLDWIGKYNYGLGLQYTFQSNPLKSSVQNDTLEGLGQPVGSGSWSNHYLLVGFVYLKTFHKLYVEGKALAGVVLSFSPVFNTMNPVDKTVSSNTGTGFAYGVQAGAGYVVSHRVVVKASLEFLQGYAKIHRQYGAEMLSYDAITGTYLYSAPLDFETKRTTSALMVKAGIVINLSK